MQTKFIQLTSVLILVLAAACVPITPSAPATNVLNTGGITQTPVIPTVAPTDLPATATPAPVDATPTILAVNPDQPPPTYALKDVSITLVRTPCFGTCPSYSVTVHGDGTVNYNGERFVKVEGAQQKQISQDAVVELLNQFYANDFFVLRPEYIEGRTVVLESDGTVRESTSSITDLPTTIVTLQIGAYTKEVRAYFQAPDALYTIATAIDETAGTAVWVKTQ